MKNIFTIIVLALFAISSFAQEKGSENVVGMNHVINSSVLKENRQIQVYLPNDYATSNKNYPVIYLLDGQRFFLYGASLVQSFSEFNLTPDFIVVGITNVQANRMRTFSAGAKEFGEYLQKEVVSFIDANYRTSKKRLLFGWAYGGGFGIETLMSKPTLFDGYVLSSPYPVSSKLKRFKEFIESNKQFNTFVYFASDAKEFGVKEGTEELHAYLKENKTNLRWTFKELSGEKHRSTVYPALYHGIQAYFENYTEISFSDLEEFNSKGGLKYVNQYYLKRFQLYGLSQELSPFSKYAIIRLAIKSNNYKQFNALVNAFKGKELLADLRASWACVIAENYTKNKQYNKAIEFYKFIVSKNKNSQRAMNGLEKAKRLK